MNCQSYKYGNAIDRSLGRCLPLLPGNTFNFNPGADRFHLSGHWEVNDGVMALADRDKSRPKPGIGGTNPPPWAPLKMTPPDCVWYPRNSNVSSIPRFVKFDKKVLCFDGYFQEPIPESPLENYRVHQCKIYYYLEDDTIQVVEPRTCNSGMPQGNIIRRGRIPLSNCCNDEFFTLDHLNIGCEVTFYAKTFYICSCDDFTRNFLNRLGIRVPMNMEMPPDMATEKRKDQLSSQFARKPHACNDTRGPFLLHDRHVLRFWAYWDDRCNLYGDLRQFVIHYYLSDATMEIREIIRPNSGYDAFPCFLRRGKLPKDTSKLVPLPGVQAPQTILNVFGSMHGVKGKKAHFVVDPLGLGARDIEYYTDKDLGIGAVVNALGRAFIITQADNFTQQYYREKYGVEDFTPLVLQKEELPQERPKAEDPPYTGWGTEEDSLVSCRSLEMKPRVSDYRKYSEMEKDILRFDAKFYCPLQSVNRDRIFNISYFMADDTVAIYEGPHPNVGLPKGGFLARGRPIKPGSERYELGEKTEFYEPKDFYIGAILKLNSFTFQLLKADEFTLSYMEKNKDIFPSADLCLCLDKMREAVGPYQAEDILKCFSQNDTSCQGVMDIGDFRSRLLEISKCSLNEHEVGTICRAYSVKAPSPGVDFQTLQAIVQTELRKFQFDKYLLERIEYTFRQRDPCRSGVIDRESLRATLKGAKLPLDREVLDFLVDKFPAGDDCNRVAYCDLLKFMDWEDNPAPIAKPAAIKCIMQWIYPQPPHKIFCVNYRAFLDNICPNIRCALPSVVCPGTQPCNSGVPLDPCCSSEEADSCQDPAPVCTEEQPPITLNLQPCFIKPIEGKSHRCAPDATKCFYEESQQNDAEGGTNNCCPQVSIQGGDQCQ